MAVLVLQERDTVLKMERLAMKGQMYTTQEQSILDQHLTLYNTLTFIHKFVFTNTKGNELQRI